MPVPRASAIQPEQYTSFGQLLRFLRQRAGLTQRELSIAVGYSESQMSRLEQNQRAPDEAALAARFVPALHLEKEPDWAARLLEVGAASRAEGRAEVPAPAGEAPLSPHNLPVQLTSFIGRETEVAEVSRLLGAGVRLLTLTGPGGTGKTRLALRAATALLARFPDGVWWVELAPLTDPALLPQTVADVLGLKEEPERPLLATLTNHLSGKRALLILDNCEHLIQASAQFAEAVLRACPQLCLMASSRELLGVAGERALPVPSLRTPGPKESGPLETLRQYDAVCLFLERAAITAPHFALTPENAPAVVQVCRRLDGIPLALELAAARLRMLPVEQIAARLDDAFRLLTGGSRTALPRHQTLQALMDWSYGLLAEAEQRLLRRLAVFAGGWTLEAAEAVCGGEGLENEAVFGLLARLIDKSVVQAEEQTGAGRYRLMETIRQYAQAKLAASGEADEVRRQHASYYLALAEVGSAVFVIRRNPAWLDQMELEHDNLRAALAWSQLAQGGAELGFRIAFALTGFWYYHGGWSEERGWIEAALAHPEAANHPRSQALAMLNLGQMLAIQGDYAGGQARVVESYRRLQELGDRLASAWALHWLGWAARERGDAATARARLEECLTFLREAEGEPFECAATNTLAQTMIMQGDIVTAKAMLEENLARARERLEIDSIGWALNHLGHVAQLRGEYEQAKHLHEDSLPLFGEVGWRNEGTIWAHQSLGETALAQGETSPATAHFAAALVMARELGERGAMAWCLAGAAALDEEPERAAWLWGAAEALRQSLGVREAPASRATHERLKGHAREQLGQAAFAAQWAAGEAAPVSAAIERALQPE